MSDDQGEELFVYGADHDADEGADDSTERDTAPAPRKRGRPAVRAPQPGDAVMDEEERLVTKLAAMPPDTQTKIYRVDELMKKWVIHGVLAPSEVSSAWIARRFGGGTYKIRVINPGENSHSYAIQATLTIPGPYKGVHGELPGLASERGRTRDDDEAPSARPTRDAIPTRELIDTAMAARMMDVLKQGQRPGLDLAGIAAVVTAAGALLSPVLNRMMTPPPPDTGVRDAMLALRDELAQMRKQPTPTTAAVGDAMKGIEQVIRLRDMLDPGTSGAKTSTTERLIEALPQMFAAFTGRPLAPPVDQPAAEDAIAVPTNPLMLADGSPNWTAIFAPYREQFLSMASNGWEPEYSAELVARVLPPDSTGLMLELLAKPDADIVELMHQAIPELRGFQRWLPEFITELRAIMAPAADAEDADDK